MTEYSGPFESSGTGLQESDWLELEDAVYPYSGYVGNYGGELAVSQHTPLAAMSVDVAIGAAVVKSSRYRNTAVKTVTIDAADSTQDRYDLIVVQRTLNAPASTIVTTVHKGTLYTAGTAVPPTRTTSATVHELVLAQVFVAHGTTAITTAMITDKRTSVDCGEYSPAVGGLIVDPDTGDFDFDGQKLKNVADPSADTDADTQGARSTAIAAALAASAASTPQLYGDGSDGAIHITSDTGSYSGIKKATTFVLDAGKTLTLTGHTVIFAKTSITINGNITGTGASPLAAGVGATTTANGGNAGGNAIFIIGSAGGSALSYTGGLGSPFISTYPGYAAALNVAFYSTTYAGVQLLTGLLLSGVFGGASGGGGAATTAAAHGGNGGKGGACLILIAPIIVIAATSTITLSGAAGAAATSTSGNAAGGGGGGNGGFCILMGKSITNGGVFTSNGGTFGAGSNSGSPYSDYNGVAGTAGSQYMAVI